MLKHAFLPLALLLAVTAFFLFQADSLAGDAAGPTRLPIAAFNVDQSETILGQPVPLSLSLKHNQPSQAAYLVDIDILAADDFKLSSRRCPQRTIHCHDRFKLGPEQWQLALFAHPAKEGEYSATVKIHYKEQDDLPPLPPQELEAHFRVLEPPDPFDLYIGDAGTVTREEDLQVALSANNMAGHRPMQISLTLNIPDGWTIKGSTAADACAPGLCTRSVTLPPRSLRDIALDITPQNPGYAPEVNIEGHVSWHFQGDKTPPRRKRIAKAVAIQPQRKPAPLPEIPEQKADSAPPAGKPAAQNPLSKGETAHPDPQPGPDPQPYMASYRPRTQAEWDAFYQQRGEEFLTYWAMQSLRFTGKTLLILGYIALAAALTIAPALWLTNKLSSFLAGGWRRAKIPPQPPLPAPIRRIPAQVRAARKYAPTRQRPAAWPKPGSGRRRAAASPMPQIP